MGQSEKILSSEQAEKTNDKEEVENEVSKKQEDKDSEVVTMSKQNTDLEPDAENQKETDIATTLAPKSSEVTEEDTKEAHCVEESEVDFSSDTGKNESDNVLEEKSTKLNQDIIEKETKVDVSPME